MKGGERERERDGGSEGGRQKEAKRRAAEAGRTFMTKCDIAKKSVS